METTDEHQALTGAEIAAINARIAEKAFEEGRAARRARTKRSDNPHTLPIPQRMWTDGWDAEWEEEDRY